MVDKDAIEKAVGEIIAGLGVLSPSNGLLDTPTRVAVAYEEIFSGIDQDPSKELAASFEADHDDLVMVRHMPFYSMCEHHLLPFFGSAHIGYVPSGKVAGVSKLARVVEILSRRPQMQERLTQQAADTIFEAVSPDGLVVMINAEHLCMTMRGIQKPGTRIVTLAVRGDFAGGRYTKEQLISILQGS